MATVHWPGREISGKRRFVSLLNTPFLLDDSDVYPDGINAFIHERVRGSRPGRMKDESRFLLKPLGKQATRKLAHNLCDILTWMETPAAHPELGKIDWRRVQPWHITELYLDAMLLGFWSETYWARRIPAPLQPATARERVGEALRCFAWTSAEGYSGTFDYEPPIQQIQRSKDDALLSYRSEMLEITVEAVSTRVRKVRRQPADRPLPTVEHLHAFFRAAPKGTPRLALRHLFETGMRAEEVIENSLIPGMVHQRGVNSGASEPYAIWPSAPYLLEHSLDDDRMLGVIPTESHAWSLAARQGYQCEYRILGKGPKIRRVRLPPVFAQALWAYIRGARRGKSAHIYVNRYGDKLSYHALWEICATINKKLQAPIDITPHVLRHAYACYFLEVGIVEKARSLGLDQSRITFSFLNEVGNTILLVIKNQLGHSEFSTTEKYLSQLSTGSMGLTYHKLWNSFLDDHVANNNG